MLQSATLASDTELRKAWEKTPIAVDFNVYVFNVTNPLEVQGGAKPSVEEIGPFAFLYGYIYLQALLCYIAQIITLGPLFGHLYVHSLPAVIDLKRHVSNTAVCSVIDL